jgi:hypothetical protein
MHLNFTRNPEVQEFVAFPRIATLQTSTAQGLNEAAECLFGGVDQKWAIIHFHSEQRVVGVPRPNLKTVSLSW